MKKLSIPLPPRALLRYYANSHAVQDEPLGAININFVEELDVSGLDIVCKFTDGGQTRLRARNADDCMDWFSHLERVKNAADLAAVQQEFGARSRSKVVVL